MRQIIIFATLLLVASCDTIVKYECQHKVTVSPLQPVKFWPVDCPTFNEKEVCGINPKCWCQPWECDDEIRAQFKSDSQQEVTQIVSDFDSDLSGWFNTSNGVDPATGGSRPDWAWSSDFGGSAKVTSVSTFGPKRLRLSTISTPSVEFTIRVTYAINDAGSSPNPRLRLLIFNASNALIYTTGNFGNADGTEHTQDFLISNPSIISAANNIQIVPASDSDIWGLGDVFNLIKVEYLYQDALDYKLSAFDKDGDELFSIPFVATDGVYNASFEPSEKGICEDKIQLFIIQSGQGLSPLSMWTNEGLPTLQQWTLGPTPSFEVETSGGANTDALRDDMQTSIAGNYTFEYDISTSASPEVFALNMLVTLLKDGVQVGSTSKNLGTGTSFNDTIAVNASAAPDEIWIQGSYTNTGAPYTFTMNSFVQTSPDNNQPEVVLYKSDCLDIQPEHACTELLGYANNRNYDGLEFSDGPFNIRVPVVFFHERGIEEDLVSEDNNQTIHLSGKDVEQRRMDTDYMPYYMHHRLRKILKMQSVLIDGTYWTKDAAYDIQEGRKDYPLKRAEVWLTKKNSIVRSIL